MSEDKSYFFVFLIAGAAVWWWLSGPDSDELVIYPANCANEVKVLPLSMLKQKGESHAERISRYKAARWTCVILPLNRTVYRLNKMRGEAYYTSSWTGAERLVDCIIFSRTNWTCSYPGGIGKVVIIDGLRAIHQEELGFVVKAQFSLRRWQWWAAKLYWMVGKPQGSCLIPEQTETSVKWRAKQKKR